MRGLWHDIRAHRLAAALFGVYWLATTIITITIWRQGVPGDSWWAPHALMGVSAGALVAWWRNAEIAALAGSALCGAVAGVLNILIQAAGYDLMRWLTNTPPPVVTLEPDAVAQPWWVGLAFLAVLFRVTCCTGAVLGIFGWVITGVLKPLARRLGNRGGRTLPAGRS